MQMKTYQKKQIIIILIILLCSLSFVIVFGRYVTNSVNDFFLRSKEFYFFSDKLSEKRDVFQVDNWSGVDDYTIVVNMNSRKNNIQVATYDIAYDIKYTCSNNAICQLSKTSGVISKEDNTDSFNLTISTTLQYSSSLSNPNVAISLYRRDYSEIYSQNYTLVDLKDYVSTILTATPREKEYVVSTGPLPTATYYLTLKDNLVTGTYKLVYKLYDGNTYIGETYEYMIIK